MSKTKKYLSLLLLIVITIGFVSCQSKEENKTIKIAASVRPHAEILKEAAKKLQNEGIDLEVLEFTDYVMPNQACVSRDVDANYFQHKPYLEQYNRQNNSDLLALSPIHYEPFGLYAGKKDSLEEIEKGVSIGLPNDVSNQARALLILEKLGWIKLPTGKDPLEVTVLDIDNSIYEINFSELAAEQLPRSLKDLDYAIINGNYALEAGLNPLNDALISEDQESEAAKTFANVLVCRSEDKDRPQLIKLVEALKSEEIKEFILETYKGAVLPLDN